MAAATSPWVAIDGSFWHIRKRGIQTCRTCWNKPETSFEKRISHLDKIRILKFHSNLITKSWSVWRQSSQSALANLEMVLRSTRRRSKISGEKGGMMLDGPRSQRPKWCRQRLVFIGYQVPQENMTCYVFFVKGFLSKKCRYQKRLKKIWRSNYVNEVQELQTHEWNIHKDITHLQAWSHKPFPFWDLFIFLSKVSVVMSPLLRPYFGVESLCQTNGEVGHSRRSHQRRFEDFKTSLWVLQCIVSW